MAYASFDGIEIAKALGRNGFEPAGSPTGSHLKMRYENPNDPDDVRVVTIPLNDADDIAQATYRSIAAQCGAKDFAEWVDWIERNR